MRLEERVYVRELGQEKDALTKAGFGLIMVVLVCGVIFALSLMTAVLHFQENKAEVCQKLPEVVKQAACK